MIVVKDIGWPFTSDKYCSECKWCQGVGGVFSKIGGVTVRMENTLVMPVHDFCYNDASDFVKGQIPT